MKCLAVGRYRGGDDLAVVVLHYLRLGHTRRPSLERHPVGLFGVGNAERDIMNSIAVTLHVIRDHAVGTESAGEYETDVVLGNAPRDAVPRPRLEAHVRDG